MYSSNNTIIFYSTTPKEKKGSGELSAKSEVSTNGRHGGRQGKRNIFLLLMLIKTDTNK